VAEGKLIARCLQDLTFGTRIIRQAPGLSAVAILLIALVIGGNATVYSMVNSILVSPATGVNGDDIIVIRHADLGSTVTDPFISFPNFEDYAQQATSITDLAGWSTERLTVGTSAGQFALSGGLVTANYFETFDVKVAHGRGLALSDDDAQDGLAVVISQRVWAERFDRAADVVGRTISIDRVAATIVGVTPPGFAGAALTPGEELWLPIRAYFRLTDGESRLADRSQPTVLVAGRLNGSASLSTARTEMATLSARIRSSYPDAFTTYSTQGVVPIQNPRTIVSRYSASALLPIADIGPTFLAVFSVVTLLTLVVVCANVANLLLGRTIERQRDLAVRRALGASRTRVVRVLLAEAATLAFAAWIASSVLTWWTSRALLRLIEPRPGLLADARPDWTLAAYGALLALLATFACSIAPTTRALKVQILPLLKSGEHSVARRPSRLATWLLVVQLAFSVLLATSAGLAYRSMKTLGSASLEFDPSNLLLVTVRLGKGTADSSNEPVDAATAVVALERVRGALATTAGVEAASYTRRIPGATLLSTTPIRRDEQRAANAFVRHVGPDYLRSLGLTMIAGRELTVSDRRGDRRVATINQRLALDLFGNEPPLGKTLFIGERNERVEIVGVVPGALFDGPTRDPHPRYIFVAEQQTPTAPSTDPSFIVRHRGGIEAMAPVVSRAIAEIDVSLPIVSLTTMKERLALVTELETSIVRLLACVAALSLVIATLGHYAVATFNVRRRTREYGIRMALGASPTRMKAAALQEALVHTVAGLAVGLALSAAVALGFRSLLFGVAPIDPITYVGVIVLFAILSLAASCQSARRASRISVVDALREE